MTADEIKAAHPADLSANTWLREIALHLALLNEKTAQSLPMPPPIVRQPGRAN